MIFTIYPIGVCIYLLALAGILGLVMGSALNCLALRLVSGEKWSGGRSHCVHCRHELGVLDLIPLFSWLFLRGKCRYCGRKISPRYMIAEALLAVVFMTVVARFGLTLQCFSALVLCGCLFCLSLVDLDIQIIPDRFLVISAVTQLLCLFITGGLAGAWYGLWHGLLLGGSVLLLSVAMDKLLHKPSMGGGDIKLLFVLGLFFDIPCCFLLLILACVLGIVLALLLSTKAGAAFPFGPALAASAWLTLIVGQSLTAWYLGLF